MGARPVVLLVLDGWGCAPPGPGNAVEQARTPVFDRLWQAHPHTTLDASGSAVGVPPGQMGNSEVGHLTIGAGRVIEQDLVRINSAIADGKLGAIDTLVEAFDRATERGSALHLVGLVSYGGVHSHIDHLRALVSLAGDRGLGDRTWVHAITDGRDVAPDAALNDIAELEGEGVSVASVCGRFYAMDRDRRWERTDRALATMLGEPERRTSGALAAVRDSHASGVTDEFIEPVAIESAAAIRSGDVVVYFNFRPDRARQLSARLLDRGLDLTTMTRYGDELDCPILFGEQVVEQTLAEIVSGQGLGQLHAAETEKYAHVTYFLNGGREDPWPGEERILVPSPTEVATYDLAPAMSAPEVASRFAHALAAGSPALGVVNFANPDMVGHTGSIPAVIEAVEATDACLGVVADTVARLGGVALVFADHGNAEQMLQPDGGPHTAHTTNQVPFIVVGGVATELRSSGGLADVAPTALRLLEIEVPDAMTGRSLLA